MKYPFTAITLLLSYTLLAQAKKNVAGAAVNNNTAIIILGNVQDAGSPHIGCRKDCCKKLFTHPDPTRKVVCLGLVDHLANKKYLFEATPDIAAQAKLLKSYLPANSNEMPDGIFVTHAHIGHYAGLMYLGKEAVDAQKTPVYVMPRMDSFLRYNGPWQQLVSRGNIALHKLENKQELKLSKQLSVTPFTVPHRDEYSETVGYIISGTDKKALFIPDIDKWEKWDEDIIKEIARVDYAFIDATFFSGAEINNRDIAQIPHPFITESMKKFENLPAAEKAKVYFIHFNHTNPVLNINSKETKEILQKGFKIARFKSFFQL